VTALDATPKTEPVTTRSHLLSLLSDACELEHALLCSYLFAAFSLKQDLSEGGMTWQQQQKVRAWAGQLYAVAAEEMLHLAQAWNLLAAIGGMPYYQRPAFPQPATYYPMNLLLGLTPFSEATLKRFVMYELPAHVSPEKMAKQLDLPADQSPKSHDLTVGELYGLILSGFETISASDLFVGDPSRQVGADVVDFPDIIKVTNQQSARAAILMIVGQGEGTERDDLNCHFGMFLRVLDDLRSETAKSGAEFDPVRQVVENPITRFRGLESIQGATLIEEAYANAVANFFNDVYGLTMQMLQFTFSSSTEISPVAKTFASDAIVVMTTVLKPIGESLMLLPAHNGSSVCAGPEFGLSRHVSLPTEPDIAQIIVGERFNELLNLGKQLSDDVRAPMYLANAVRNLALYIKKSV
jgi:hypothetical protein